MTSNIHHFPYQVSVSFPQVSTSFPSYSVTSNIHHFPYEVSVKYPSVTHQLPTIRYQLPPVAQPSVTTNQIHLPSVASSCHRVASFAIIYHQTVKLPVSSVVATSVPLPKPLPPSLARWPGGSSFGHREQDSGLLRQRTPKSPHLHEKHIMDKSRRNAQTKRRRKLLFPPQN